MELKDESILVVGAGITGLSLAYWLTQQGKHVILVEAAAQAGGVMATHYKEGFEINEGPVSCASTPLIEQLANELNLTVEYPTTASSKRFIYSQNKMHHVSPLTLLAGSLLSVRGKIALFRDLFCKAYNEPQQDESIASFARRHFGEEAHQKLLAPVIGGIYAGDTEKLSMQYCLPKLREITRKHGSLLKGFRKEDVKGNRKIISFEGGLVRLIHALEQNIKQLIRYNAKVISFSKDDQGYRVTIRQGEHHTTGSFSKIYFTVPAYALADIIKPVNETLSQQLLKVNYAPVTQWYLTADKTQVDGFGFLVPPADGLPLLGAINLSGIFPAKAPSGKSLFVVFTNSSAQAQSEKILADELSRATGARQVRCIHSRTWPRAIPQPHVGHANLFKHISHFEEQHPGIRCLGNFISGVSVGDCVAAAYWAAHQK
ncbi:MAG: protoporphyrinogen oxidase [Cyclobacteriaceae bacterium]|nr:protoporphyrinogen oxidase [Cyclobacteriaceae bacterium]